MPVKRVKTVYVSFHVILKVFGYRDSVTTGNVVGVSVCVCVYA